MILDRTGSLGNMRSLENIRFSVPPAFSFYESYEGPINYENLKKSVNLIDTDGEYFIQMELPGVNPDTIDIDVKGQKITVKASTSLDIPEKGKFIWKGFSNKEIFETITLPSEVYGDKARAEYQNGVLILTLPKSKRTTKIKVSNK